MIKSNRNLGDTYHTLREYHKAIDYYKKGLVISTAIGDRSRIESRNANLGNAYDSLENIRRQLTITKKI
jgi:tetratricopeptide (TPR) repeat protein